MPLAAKEPVDLENAVIFISLPEIIILPPAYYVPFILFHKKYTSL